MKKKVMCIFAAVLLALSVFAIAGCKVSNTQKPDSEVKPDENKEASVFLNVGVLQKSSEKNLMQTWINAFQKKYPEVSITISKTYSSMSDLITYKTSNALPDICWTAGDQHAEYSDPLNMGYFRNLADESKFDGSAKFFGGFYDELIDTTHLHGGDDGIWFVPRDYNRLVIYYNKTVFDQMGLALPTDTWTWNDFTSICNKLVAGANGVKCKKAIEWRNWAPVHYTMARNFGADYIDDTGRFTFDTDEGKACFDWYKNWVKDIAVIGQATRAWGAAAMQSPPLAPTKRSSNGLGNSLNGACRSKATMPFPNSACFAPRSKICATWASGSISTWAAPL